MIRLAKHLLALVVGPEMVYGKHAVAAIDWQLAEEAAGS